MTDEIYQAILKEREACLAIVEGQRCHGHLELLGTFEQRCDYCDRIHIAAAQIRARTEKDDIYKV